MLAGPEQNDASKPLTESCFIIDKITRHTVKANTLVVYKRHLTFENGLLVKHSPSIASEEVPIAMT
jgi:hypothetical protein